jgi:glycosyltransferase involved in cell wall biosynthesis
VSTESASDPEVQPSLVRPYVSVVIAVRNGGTTLQRCLDSVINQLFEAWELIVIDGGSSDGSQEILRRNQASLRYWVSEPDRGIYQAWNKALAKASGEWICFLGADDRFHDPVVLRELAGSLRAAEGKYRVVYASIDKVMESGQVLFRWGRPWSSVREEFRHGMAIPHQAIFHNRSLFELHGRFDESYRISGDYEFLLRELVDHDALFVPDVLVVDMAAGGLADRTTNRGPMLRESSRARRAHGLESRMDGLNMRLVLFRGSVRMWLRRTLGPRAEEHAARAYRFIARKHAQRNGHDPGREGEGPLRG